MRFRCFNDNSVAALSCLLSCLLVAPLLAQVDRATLVGTVSDPSGAVIPGATVEITSADTGLHRDVKTGSAGNYSFAALPIGNYVINVTQAGFKNVTLKDVRLQVGDNRTLDINMQILADTTTISVEAQAAQLDRRVGIYRQRHRRDASARDAAQRPPLGQPDAIGARRRQYRLG